MTKCHFKIQANRLSRFWWTYSFLEQCRVWNHHSLPFNCTLEIYPLYAYKEEKEHLNWLNVQLFEWTDFNRLCVVFRLFFFLYRRNTFECVISHQTDFYSKFMSLTSKLVFFCCLFLFLPFWSSFHNIFSMKQNLKKKKKCTKNTIIYRINRILSQNDRKMISKNQIVNCYWLRWMGIENNIKMRTRVTNSIKIKWFKRRKMPENVNQNSQLSISLDDGTGDSIPSQILPAKIDFFSPPSNFVSIDADNMETCAVKNTATENVRQSKSIHSRTFYPTLMYHTFLPSLHSILTSAAIERVAEWHKHMHTGINDEHTNSLYPVHEIAVETVLPFYFELVFVSVKWHPPTMNSVWCDVCASFSSTFVSFSIEKISKCIFTFWMEYSIE